MYQLLTQKSCFEGMPRDSISLSNKHKLLIDKRKPTHNLSLLTLRVPTKTRSKQYSMSFSRGQGQRDMERVLTSNTKLKPSCSLIYKHFPCKLSRAETDKCLMKSRVPMTK